MALLLLCGCGKTADNGTNDAEIPVSTVTSAEDELPEIEGMQTVEVTNIDEFLAAIASDTLIYMRAGHYDLTEALDFAAVRPFNPNLSWNYYYDGYELQINGVRNLSIIGDSRETVELVTRPRYAHVIRFSCCENVCISSMTLGHTDGGACMGGVLAFDNVIGAGIMDAELYGCGIRGISAVGSRYIYTESSTVRDCSEGAAYIESCEDVRFTDCDIYGCGYGEWATHLFDVLSTDGFALVNSRIYGNTNLSFVSSNYTKNAYILGNEVRDCTFEYIFSLRGYDITADGCSFADNDFGEWFAEEELFGALPGTVLDMAGNALTEEELGGMPHEKTDFAMPHYEQQTVQRIETPEGSFEVHATNVDEFLAGIAPNTTIYLDAEVFKLFEASDYGVGKSAYYTWENEYDGFELKICGVTGLKIVGGMKNTEIQASSRWSNVLSFSGCTDVEVIGIKAGHVEGQGTCSGGVILFENCTFCRVTECRLYGCGICGVTAWDSSALKVTDTEIYDCSNNAVYLYSCDDVHFADCTVYDCGGPNLYVYECGAVFYNDAEVNAPMDIKPDGTLKLSDMYVG